MKPMNLLAMVQDIIESLGSEPVNSISDTAEAYQIANFVKNAYHDLLTNRHVPDFESLVKLVPYSDNSLPTFVHYPEDIKEMKAVWYDIGPIDVNNPHVTYKEILFLQPEEFLRRCNYGYDETDRVEEPVSGSVLYIRNNNDPSYWTTFDNHTLIFDSYDKTKDDSIQEHKLRALGAYYPDFRIEDLFVPRLQGLYFPMLLNEAKSRSFSLLKGYIDPKIEQAARRQRYAIQNDKFIDDRPAQWNDYGRGGCGSRSHRVRL